MKTEDIQKAAEQFSFTETVDARERFLITSGFKTGAHWRINSIWHKRTEPAEEGNDIILLFPDGKCSVITFDGDWELFITWMLLEKWAYLKDIFPENFVKSK